MNTVIKGGFGGSAWGAEAPPPKLYNEQNRKPSTGAVAFVTGPAIIGHVGT